MRVLERKLARLTAATKAERLRHERRVAAMRRDADRRLASMVAEIASLRHLQARADALERLIAERDAALAAQAERLARLEALLQGPTALG
jgi:hypothetical protein